MFTNGGLLSDNNTSEEDEDGSSSSKGETVKSVEILRNFYEKLRMCTNREEGGSKIGALKSMVAFVRELPHAQLQVVAGALFMLARDAPFGEIRKSFSNLLEDLKVNYHRSMPSIVSAFFAFNPEGLKRDEEDEELVRDVFEKSFLAHFRVPNLYKVLSWHPSYLDRYEALRESLVCGEGPLNVPWRHYIAIIAASRHRCRYITASHIFHFIQSNGDEQWLKGVDRTPPKLRKLLYINALLAHQPWMLQAEHIRDMTTGENSWVLPELVHALVLLCIFHSTSGLCFSLGILPETDIARIFFRVAGKVGDFATKNVRVAASTRELVENDDVEASGGAVLSVTKKDFSSMAAVGTRNIYSEDIVRRSACPRDCGELLSGEGASLSSIVELEAVRLNPDLVATSDSVASSSKAPARDVEKVIDCTSGGSFAPNIESERMLRKVLTKDLDKLLKEKSEKNIEQVFHSAATDDADAASGITKMTSSLPSPPPSKAVEDGEKIGVGTPPSRKHPVAATPPASLRPEDYASELGRFAGDFPMQYVDFFMASRAQKCSVLRVQDYSWDTQCYAIVSRFFPASADAIDDVFREIYSLTYRTLGSSDDVDTTKYRQAVWHYAQSLLGVRNDDFDYRQINLVLDRKLKVYVKKIVCAPETITKEDWEFSDVLTYSERCHIALLASNARAQASLMYALRALHKMMM